jgi:hypothetical protein
LIDQLRTRLGMEGHTGATILPASRE